MSNTGITFKCKKCGREIIGTVFYYNNSEYYCKECIDELNKTKTYDYPNFDFPTYNNYGWICPKCGAVMSPSTPVCFYCTPKNKGGNDD